MKCQGAQDLSVVQVSAPYDPWRSQKRRKNENIENRENRKNVRKIIFRTTTHQQFMCARVWIL